MTQAMNVTTVLVGLHVPGIDGYQVMVKIKTDDRTKSIPNIVLTIADNTVEIERCSALLCNGCIVKSIDYARFAEGISKFRHFPSVVKLTDGR